MRGSTPPKPSIPYICRAATSMTKADPFVLAGTRYSAYLPVKNSNSLQISDYIHWCNASLRVLSKTQTNALILKKKDLSHRPAGFNIQG